MLVDTFTGLRSTLEWKGASTGSRQVRERGGKVLKWKLRRRVWEVGDTWCVYTAAVLISFSVCFSVLHKGSSASAQTQAWRLSVYRLSDWTRNLYTQRLTKMSLSPLITKVDWDKGTKSCCRLQKARREPTDLWALPSLWYKTTTFSSKQEQTLPVNTISCWF